jgi:hypothetical protein
MPETKRPLKVFLCHASQDKPVVRELSRHLVGEGWIDTWLDETKLLPGQDWRLNIEEAVETSDIVIICLSSNSVSKEGHVQKELRYAREIAFEKPEETIFLIPLRLDDCIVPRGLRFFQWGDYFGEKKEDTYTALLEALKIRHGQRLKLEEVERARLEKERLERETIEKAAREKVERETAERKAREEAERIAREKVEREVTEKARQEKKERLNARKAALAPFLKISGFTGIAIALLWGILWIPHLPLFTLTPSPSATVTFTVTPIPPTKTLTPTATKTKLPTLTPTFTSTPTPIPTNSILLQEDFEDNMANGWWSWNESWTSREGPDWTIEQEANGNYYASASQTNDPPRIWYGDKSLRWIDYAFESRVKFVGGNSLGILVHADGGDLQYAVDLDGSGNTVFAQWNGSRREYKELGRATSKAFVLDRWYIIRIEIVENLLSLYIDNSLVRTQELPIPLMSKQGGLGYNIFGEKIDLDDIRVWSLK